ncbi:LPXTG cell wall anchor domain-containing protein [Streptococcus sp. sy018]|uniref:LPXTG cell wall anchor domain-containing protein n=1 Tax=Streptococcus sp. sy018 TaxID=2600147 RepID=UPI0011B48731|nr:LPXTG cell wall anchor domain-containing protein [Streptococcus sp. sy018]TWS94843.1 LPXTG cell wall anchor domain-containing protein [Streptococcus sp. sy018]
MITIKTKKTKTILAAGTIATLGLAGNVKAEEVAVPTNQPVAETQAQEVTVTAEQVTEAQTTVDTTSNQVMVATTAVDTAQTAVDTAQADSTQAATNLETAQTLLAQAEEQATQVETAPTVEETLMVKDSVSLPQEEYSKQEGVTQEINGETYLGDPNNSWSYSGEVEEVVELTPEQAKSLKETGDFEYTPDMAKVSEYMAQYINEFNEANGITANVVADSDAIRAAQARAEENAERNEMTHSSKLYVRNTDNDEVGNYWMTDRSGEIITKDKVKSTENASQGVLFFEKNENAYSDGLAAHVAGKKLNQLSATDTSYSNIRSDKELANYLFLGWFADTRNVELKSNERRQQLIDMTTGKIEANPFTQARAVGHRTAMMGRVGYVGVGLAKNANEDQTNPNGVYQAIMTFMYDNNIEAKKKDTDFRMNSVADGDWEDANFNKLSYAMVDKNLTSTTYNMDGSVSSTDKVDPTFVQYYKGKEVVAGPRRTYRFVVKSDIETLKAETQANLTKAKALVAKASEQKVAADASLTAALASLETKRQTLKEALLARDEAVNTYNKIKGIYDAQALLADSKGEEVVEVAKPVETPAKPAEVKPATPTETKPVDVPTVPTEVKPVEPAKSTETKPVETPAQPTETKPVEVPAKPTEAKPVETPAQPTATKPVETPAKPTEVKPVEVPTKPTETKPVEVPATPTEVKPVEVPATPTEVKPVETPAKSTEVKPVEVPAKPTEVKPVEVPAKPTATKPVETLRHKPIMNSFAQSNPQDYQKLVNKVNQAMSKPVTDDTNTEKRLPQTGVKETSFLALIGVTLLGLVGLKQKKARWEE